MACRTWFSTSASRTPPCAIYEQLLIEDHDEDGVLDSTQQLAEVTLIGETVDHVAIQGSDRVRLFLAGKSLRQLLQALFGS